MFRALRLSLFILLLGGLCWSFQTWAYSVPPAPLDFVWDEPGILSQTQKAGIALLLRQHEKVTGEQVVIVVLNELPPDAELNDYTNALFKEWKIGKKDKNNGVLLALFWKNKKARIEVGYGLEPVLTDLKSKLILVDVLIPEIKLGDLDRAISLASLEILKTLGSPLIQDGSAYELLKSRGFNGKFEPTPVTQQPRMISLVLFVAMLFLILVIKWLSEAETHFSSSGRTFRRPWSGTSGWGGGGWGSSSSGSDGFGGGGGMSGGGGASGEW